jgi:hypothetical protein
MSTNVRIALAVAMRARVPVLLWGGAGLGKSSAVREMAAAADLPCETVIASIREPSDFAGLPIVTEGGTSVRFAAPDWAERLAASGRGILFLDEISTAPPAVQAALLRVVLERVVGDVALPADVTVVAAANPPEQAADGWDLSPPLANRFCHLDWDLDAQEWAHGMLAGFELPIVNEVSGEALARAQGRALAGLTGFVSSRPHLLHAHPGNEAAAGRAWPSPRSWQMASRLLAYCDEATVPESVPALLLAGVVGPAVAAEFLAWREDLQLPNPEDVLRDPDSFALPERGDRAFAALAALTAAVLSHNTPDRWEAAWRAIAAGTAEGRTDIAIAAIRTLIAHRPAGAVPAAATLTKMAPVLKTAGLFEALTGSSD